MNVHQQANAERMRRELAARDTPGSPAAVERGCICPTIDYEAGKHWHNMEGVFVIYENCPVHRPAERE